MEHLIEPQIRDSCRLALPEGLKDLMSDISREVLRAQPEDLYQFITDYLSVLLVAREHLFIAARVCDDVCRKRCRHDLEEELRKLSLSEEDVKKSLKIIMEYFSSDQVKEGNLLQKLMLKTNIGLKELAKVQEAIRRAFLRHQLKETSMTTPPSEDDELDEIALAAKHTLNIYEKASKQPDLNYDCVASRIQAAYRAYSVKRKRTTGPAVKDESMKRSVDKVRFHMNPMGFPELEKEKSCPSICSSMSLAGSYLSLESSILNNTTCKHHVTAEEVGVTETEHFNIEQLRNALRSQLGLQHSQDANTEKVKKTISFHGSSDLVNNELMEEEFEAEHDKRVEVKPGDSEEAIQNEDSSENEATKSEEGETHLLESNDQEIDDYWGEEKGEMTGEYNSEEMSSDTKVNIIKYEVKKETVTVKPLGVKKSIYFAHDDEDSNDDDVEDNIELLEASPSNPSSVTEDLNDEISDDNEVDEELTYGDN